MEYEWGCMVIWLTNFVKKIRQDQISKMQQKQILGLTLDSLGNMDIE
jgi:hypothetical protein